MKRSCNFYSQIPGFKLVYGDSSNDSFTPFQIGKDDTLGYLNLIRCWFNQFLSSSNSEEKFSSSTSIENLDKRTIVYNIYSKQFGKKHRIRIEKQKSIQIRHMKEL